MQFREQGKKVQCIRSTYNRVSKRNDQKMVGSFDRMADNIPTVGLEQLTALEHEQLKVWFAARQVIRAERANQHRVMSAASSLTTLGESIKSTGAAMTDSEATATWLALAGVARALRKVGHPKPKRVRSSLGVLDQTQRVIAVESDADPCNPSSAVV